MSDFTARAGNGFSRDSRITRIGKDGIRRDSRGKEEFRCKYFLAFEGLAEHDYFKGVRDNFVLPHKKGGAIDLQLINRDFCNKDRSDPKFNMRMLRDYVHALSNPREITPALALSRIVSQIHDIDEAWDGELHRMFNDLYEALVSSEACGDRYVEDSDAFMGGVYDFLGPRDVPEQILKRLEYPVFNLGYNPDLDRLCLIIDRDYCGFSNPQWEDPGRTKEYYKELVQECHPDSTSELKHVRLFVSNPTFEFWLTLHFDESLDFSDEMRSKLNFDHKEEFDEKTSFLVLNDIIQHRFGESYNKTKLKF